MKYFIYITLFIIASLFYGCSHSSERLEAVLKYSGTNRPELEKVLEHYSQDPKDSLKLKSAIFLIENMPGHYTFSGPLLDHYYTQLDSIKYIPYHEKKFLQMIPFEYSEYRNDSEIREDVKCVTADFLIHNIELAFRQWQSYPWLEGLDFDDFREYLLPYRVENEPLDYWRDSIGYFRQEQQDYVHYYDDCRHSVLQMSHKFYGHVFDIANKIPDKNLKNFKMECIPTSKVQLIFYRIVGIPSSIDFIPHFANRNGRHYWATKIDPKLNTFQVYQAAIYRAAKIYRRTFSHNPAAVPQGNEYIPFFFRDPFNRDVTSLYLPVTDITVDVPRKIKKKHAYLAVFNDLTWKPIACTEISGQKACFRNMGKDIVYLPVYYDEDEELHPLSAPFIVFSDGEIQQLDINGKAPLQQLTLTRKYPNSSEHNYWFKELIGCRFEASDRADFKNADTIYHITQKTTCYYQHITPDPALKKRYWRFICPTRWGVSLADLKFYNAQGQIIKGKLTAPDTTYVSKVFDEDPLTSSTVEWTGMDFGKPVHISKISYLGKNDANGIYPGYEYELFYYHYPEGWISLGTKTTGNYELIYDQVPAGGLYWLRNLTTGQEERIFTWEKGKTRFW